MIVGLIAFVFDLCVVWFCGPCTKDFILGSKSIFGNPVKNALVMALSILSSWRVVRLRFGALFFEGGPGYS